MVVISKEPQIREKFEGFLSNYKKIYYFIDDLEKKGIDIILFGGIVRNYYENNFSEKPRDIDIVLHSCIDFDFEKYLELNNYSYYINKFGGYKLELDELNIDIWSIEKTWAFKENIITFRNLKDLNKTVFLSTDAIFYNFTSKQLFDNGFLESIQKKEIDIVLEKTPFPEINLVKAFYLKNKFNLNFSSDLSNYYSQWLSKKENKRLAIEELNLLSNKRYGCKIL
ncbi:hypothetical protein [Planococcus ruber]|uniref:hypothetical protein n=1 Tax=Planococcus ruber TaxID=2027871 RepID=UPI001FEEBFF9|nr:hypothetical protein [Planococcus ruber]MCJ1909962.1 hypothetical protein [Planococcus ruber]